MLQKAHGLGFRFFFAIHGGFFSFLGCNRLMCSNLSCVMNGHEWHWSHSK
jgi:hypothetical protein